MREKSDRANGAGSVVANDGWQEGIQQLLKQSKVSFLATIGELGPETSMAPFAIYQDNVLLHLSTLAKHSTNIERQPGIGLMICTPETAGESPLSLPRLSLQGNVTVVPDEQLEVATKAYLRSIPDAEMLFSFTDFRLFQLSPSSIHWVGGFGKARKVSLQQWQGIQ